MIEPELVHFRRSEFTRGGVDWWPRMDPRLLVLLDVFRHQWGKPVEISAHPDALGRDVAVDVVSDHNVNRHGMVLAVDVQPAVIIEQADARRAIRIARAIGFTAIGFYPNWRPRPGLHLGTRRDRRPEDPAVWGAVAVAGAQTYVSLDEALARLPMRS